jgi:hypothetical protein
MKPFKQLPSRASAEPSGAVDDLARPADTSTKSRRPWLMRIDRTPKAPLANLRAATTGEREPEGFG